MEGHSQDHIGLRPHQFCVVGKRQRRIELNLAMIVSQGPRLASAKGYDCAKLVPAEKGRGEDDRWTPLSHFRDAEPFVEVHPNYGPDLRVI